MDPQQCWTDLLEALKRNDWDAAQELADALSAWLRKNGFPPITVGAESLGARWHRTIASFVCLHVANHLSDMQQLEERNSPQKRGGE